MQEAGIDYICFTDRPRSGCGVFQIEAMDYLFDDPARAARYVKTHPHLYLAGYDYAVWLDANIAFHGRIHDYVAKLAQSGLSFGAISHPLRDCVYEEAAACRRMSYDDPARIEAQMGRYRQEGFPRHGGLIETNFFLCRPGDPMLGRCFDLWWKEIDSGSRRDQLSLTYALAKQKCHYMHCWTKAAPRATTRISPSRLTEPIRPIG
jgi:hypothetical protein